MKKAAKYIYPLILVMAPIILLGQARDYNHLPTKEVILDDGKIIRYQKFRNHYHGHYQLIAQGKTIEKGEFIANKANRNWVSYYKTGHTRASVNYVKGIKHGEWKVYYENGELMYSYAYKRGKPTGVWKHYSPQGELLAYKKN